MDGLPPVITSKDFQGLYSRHDFTQAGKGCKEFLNAELVEMSRQLTTQAVLQAEHEKHSGLNASHAQKANEMTPEIPKGIY